MQVRSTVSGNRHAGEVRAVVAQPFGIVSAALARPEHWCDILMLQVNVKRCEAPGGGAAPTVAAFITRKPRDGVESAYRVEFRAHAAAGNDLLRVALASREGPFGTRNYQIRLEAAPLDANSTTVQLSYEYTLGFSARLAMDAYLSTSGREKSGFSVVDRQPDGQPVYASGVHGMIERGAMRYYLAVEAFLGSLDAPPAERLEARLREWYAGTQRYPQLREPVSAAEYLEMKRHGPPPPARSQPWPAG